MPETVILVDENDNQTGLEEKMKAHREGKLHRAFSVFVFNEDKLLLQKRSKSKYHSAGLWTNTCCSHPRVGEPMEIAVHRRLVEEMGFDCKLRKIFSFLYKFKFDIGIFEHEYDYVFVGRFDGDPKPDPEQVDDWKWVELRKLYDDIKQNPESYTYWFKIAYHKLVNQFANQILY